jgi:hypothetical protein
MNPSRFLARLAGSAACVGSFAPAASATWSILIADTRTGEIAVGSATCVPNIDLRENTPVLLLGRGAVTAQSVVDTSGLNRARVFAGYARGDTPATILAELAATDAGHDNRQYGFIDALGNAETYSGPQNAAWAGGVTGRIDLYPEGPENDIVYAVQGNILTGDAVVLAAESAILNTPGDLAEKLMAAMEAAYAFGGDGRCSCTTGGPTDCGAPPPSFIKTADVGYMLVGRLGDRDQGGSFHPLNGIVGESLIGDLDGDGRIDLVTTPSFGGAVELHRNVAPDPGGPLVFESGAITGNLSLARFAELADAEGDGDLDLLYATTGAGYVVVNTGGGAFSPAVETSLGSGILGGVAGDFDTSNGPRPEVALITASQLRTYGVDPVSGMALEHTLPLGATARVITRSSGGVAVGFSNGAIIPFHSAGDGTFSLGSPVSIQAAATTLHASDFNGDGVDDYVAGRGDQRVSIVVSIPGDDGYVESEINLGAAVRDTVMADFDGDGDDDFAVLLTFGRVRVYLNDGAGGFSVSPQVRVLEGASFTAGDMTGDGRPEIVTAASRVLGVYLNEGQGPADNDRGFAGGDYFLEFNVANGPSAGYDDPVPELRDLFDAWRAAREDTPDGSSSKIFDPPARVNLLGSRAGPYQFEVQLRNYDGRLVTAAPGQFEIVAPPGQPALLEITGVADDPDGKPGEYIVTAETTGATGRSALWVRINAQPWHAVIMPAPEIIAGRTLADMDANGLLDLTDIVLFVGAFNAQDPSADLDDSGLFDGADLNLFVTEFLAG